MWIDQNSHNLWQEEGKTVPPAGKTLCHFHTIKKKYINSVPAILLLGTYTREMKTYVHFFHTRNVYKSFIHDIP